MASDATTSGAHPSPGNPIISWPIERTSHTNEPGWRPPPVTRRRSSSSSSSSSNNSASTSSTSSSREVDIGATNYPGGKMALDGIALRAFLLGTTLGGTLGLALFLGSVYETALWRVPFFIGALSIFHFLEFWVTARYNTRYATVSAFLLSSNGWAYNAAHGSAVVECVVSHLLWPGRQSALARSLSFTEPITGTSVSVLLLAGFFLVVLGQVVRTLAMAQAASNFNHHVQVEHKQGHVLVKSGLYRFFRHPSYFGFFWWGLGTQLVLGNVLCLVGYAAVLWRFFSSRIKREEAFLIQFFGAEYVQYKEETPVGIPGIR
ncbi:hypothetical protein NUU61_008772 [Penicillium alfredii]|uniref:Protein-S-isoprenylcysteine O-methyltransferase n=1 Tax=Penicillium alfredii TaxID=1506179 RepID=A0A9W9JWJ5_9EURO|nr:uncharacterized protein NUU61_008772 [Penicillium alfredii]KAJ5084193.1 hypothetical protein NUU61_008772 [Penicillium alfredii]